MNEPLFRVGGVYRQACGGIRKLAGHENQLRCYALTHWGEGVFSTVGGGDGARNLKDGRYIWHSGAEHDYLTLIPGELRLVNGQWVPVEKSCPDCGTPEGSEHGDCCPRLPSQADRIAAHALICNDPNAPMLARDAANYVARPAPVVIQEPTKPSAHAAIAGLTQLGAVDHRFGSFRF
jgi:hypothetical protein